MLHDTGESFVNTTDFQWGIVLYPLENCWFS